MRWKREGQFGEMVVDAETNQDVADVFGAGEELENRIRLIANAPALYEALKPFAKDIVRDDLNCHAGLTTKEKCCRCSKIIAAQAAISLAEGEGV